MFGALLKKQFKEFFSVFTMQENNKKTDGKDDGKGRMILVALILIYAFGTMVYSSWTSAAETCELYVAQGKADIFFFSACAQALGLALLIGTLMAKGLIYDAKDNETLLALPISPNMMLLARVCMQYIYMFFFVLGYFAPAAVKYFMVVGVQPLAILFCVLVLLLLPLLALAVSSFLGWLSASLTANLPKKHFLSVLSTVVMVLIGLACYLLLINYSMELGVKGEPSTVVKVVLFPILHASAAASGNALSALWFVLSCAVLCGLVYWLMSATFLKIVTTEKGEIKTVYKEEKAQVSSANAALLRKECARLLKTSIYFMNGAISTIFLLVGFIFLLVVAIGDLGADIRTMLAGDFGVLVGGAAIAFIAAMSTITASSVSLEGDSLYLVQSLPVSSGQVLFCKWLLHVLFVGIPALLCVAVLPFVIPVSALNAGLVGLNVLVVVAVTAAIGLALNLKLPMLKWSNEMVPVKQSMAVMAAMGAQAALVATPALLWEFVSAHFTAWAYLLCTLAFFVIVGVLVYLWLQKTGTKTFEEL